MADSTTSISITLPLEVVQLVDAAAERDGIPRSAFLQQAVERAVRNHKWQKILAYGREQAHRLGIEPDDVTRLVEEYREEMA